MGKSADRLEPSIKRWRIVGLVFIGVIALLLAWVAVKSAQLRPGGDDYCLAVGAQFGPVGGPAYWWENFSGFLTPTIAANTLVGLTLLNLPLSVASAIPFLVTAALVAVAAVSVTPLTTARSHWAGGGIGRFGMRLIASAVSVVAWWTYWWLPMSLGAEGDNRFLAQSITHNQTPNAGHVFQTAAVILLLFLGLRLATLHQAASVILTASSGLVAGFSGPAMALALTLAYLVVLVGRWLKQPLLLRVPLTPLWIPIPVALLTLAVSLAAPGSRARASELGTPFHVSLTSVGELVNALFPRSVAEWAAGYLTWGAAAVLLLTASASWLAASWGVRVAARDGLLATTALALFSLMLAITAVLGQQFSYNAFWHFLDNRVVAFASMVVFGAVLGSWSQRRWSEGGALLALILVIVSLALAVGSVLTLTISIAARDAQWEVGPAPIAGVVTELLDDPRGPTCWGALTHLRELPLRGVTRELPAWNPAERPLMGAR